MLKIDYNRPILDYNIDSLLIREKLEKILKILKIDMKVQLKLSNDNHSMNICIEDNIAILSLFDGITFPTDEELLHECYHIKHNLKANSPKIFYNGNSEGLGYLIGAQSIFYDALVNRLMINDGHLDESHKIMKMHVNDWLRLFENNTIDDVLTSFDKITIFFVYIKWHYIGAKFFNTELPIINTLSKYIYNIIDSNIINEGISILNSWPLTNRTLIDYFIRFSKIIFEKIEFIQVNTNTILIYEFNKCNA